MLNTVSAPQKILRPELRAKKRRAQWPVLKAPVAGWRKGVVFLDATYAAFDELNNFVDAR